MSRFHLYLQSAKQIIRQYGGAEPLSGYLKRFFSLDKKYGSRDRKSISSIVYSYYRAGQALGRVVSDQTLLQALFLCGTDAYGTLRNLKPEWAEKMEWPVEKRLDFFGLKPFDLCAFTDLLSKQVDATAYCLSLLEQPDLFLRMRPGREALVQQALIKADIPFSPCGNAGLRLSNQSPLNNQFRLNRDAVVQDLSSQQVLNDLVDILPTGVFQNPISAWDCCAASGGKSILLYDLLNGNVALTLSDIRKSILQHAETRLKEASVPIEASFLADLTNQASVRNRGSFPLIIVDVPCTGSGTWSRTPEQAYYFDREALADFSKRQRHILETIVTRLAEGGIMQYITCSVFAAENEELINSFLTAAPIQKVREQYYLGFGMKADSLYSATCIR